MCWADLCPLAITYYISKESRIHNTSPLPESHTGDAIRLKCGEMLDKWDINCFVVNIVANVKKVKTDAAYNYVGCFAQTLHFAYTLKLVISDGILSQ